MFFKHDDNKYKIICSKLMFNVMPQPPFFGEHLARDQKCAVQNSGTIFFFFFCENLFISPKSQPPVLIQIFHYQKH